MYDLGVIDIKNLADRVLEDLDSVARVQATKSCLGFLGIPFVNNGIEEEYVVDTYRGVAPKRFVPK